jgi:16S rRNA (guanine527-N7)-methyltransferase
MGAEAEHLKGFSPSEIQAAVAPRLTQPLPAAAYALLARYVKLLTHWNQKINLTAIHDPKVLVNLHLAECLRAAQRIRGDIETLLDLGSGAGLPGIPIQIARPELRVTLAESQKKKAAFLREALRELGLQGASVHADRVENMPSATVFDTVTLRAVDKMGVAMHAAIPRIRPPHGGRGGDCLVLTSQSEVATIQASSFDAGGKMAIEWEGPDSIPGTDQRVILLGSRVR